VDQRDRTIIAQVAVKEASNLTAARISAGEDVDVVSHVEALADWLFDKIVAIANGPGTTAEVVANVQQAFPGAVVEPFPAPAAAPAHPSVAAPLATVTPLPVPGAPQAGGGIHAASSPEELWHDLFHGGTGLWEDRRQTKTNPKAPDFTHKTLKKGKFSVGLWVNDKTTPQWVRQHLGA
jgi:hypothetical protein